MLFFMLVTAGRAATAQKGHLGKRGIFTRPVDRMSIIIGVAERSRASRMRSTELLFLLNLIFLFTLEMAVVLRYVAFLFSITNSHRSVLRLKSSLPSHRKYIHSNFCWALL